jgi:hypothetical protein
MKEKLRKFIARIILWAMQDFAFDLKADRQTVWQQFDQLLAQPPQPAPAVEKRVGHIHVR